METRLSPEVIALWEVPPTYAIGEVSISESLQIFTLVDLKRNHEKNATGSLVCLELDDQPRRPRKLARSIAIAEFIPIPPPFLRHYHQRCPRDIPSYSFLL
ncbi:MULTISPECIES: hypothetical protein [Arthrospira]|uniref:Uncharacterized protein n=1 Tax=Limnospira platensis NIES-46 TaxID=1236695 RepID=A0A5M3T3P9_LIMPL|nr:hypothetical protein [Arthrospira platensis]MDF2211514.1 hypothetical protein [Arthrospira platensis NCB002]MDT9185352.1 hypothetical protein [Limnospira sp. PMC 289.06]MDT9295588.1 hypothetical protein [Arthrospira platensis PCC 7345]MDT9312032.1 hypothetical protein [Limnospira sp. Paracas R14]WAK74227.1 hypothetical protein AP9108_32890 [Arthrospira sp. PCC 9108]BAI88449.1 hypothetical protein NIES39_A06110 [Arthrospira platensis NIES-39]